MYINVKFILYQQTDECFEINISQILIRKKSF